MKWTSTLLFTLLVAGSLCTLAPTLVTGDEKAYLPAVRRHKWRSTFFPADADKSKFKRTRPFNLGSTTFDQFRETLSASAAQKDKAWQDLYNKQGDPFVAKLFKNGITHFSSSTSLEADEGVEKKDLDEYCNHVVGKLGVPAGDRPSVIGEMKLAALSTEGETKIMSAVFKSGPGGSGRFVTILSAKDKVTKEYDFVLINVQASFEIGPDIIAVTVQKSALWGLIRWKETHYIKRAAEISEETINLVFDFFKFAAFEKLKDFLK